MIRSARLSGRWLVVGLAAVVVAAGLGITVGPVTIPPGRALLEVLDQLPWVDVDSGLSGTQAAIVSEIRLPRVTLGLMVGALLASSGAAYQGVFRNPLADPFLLGVAAGAGLGATLAIVGGIDGVGGVADPIAVMAFAGAMVAVLITVAVGTTRNPIAGPATLVLAGVAVASFFTAMQLYLQQRYSESLREVYSWIFGRLTTSGWHDVTLLAPYAAVALVVMLLTRGHLDVLAVGDEEASSLGLRPRRVRLAVVAAASLGAAAAVAVSGLIGFVGLIVPHAVRLVAGVSNRVVVPLSMLFGAAFLALTDLAARTLQSPAELPIGVVTAFLGAPFFILILRNRLQAVA